MLGKLYHGTNLKDEKEGWRNGSSGRVPTQQAWRSPEFKIVVPPKTNKQKTDQKMKKSYLQTKVITKDLNKIIKSETNYQ
jgi:hypothetical protein